MTKKFTEFATGALLQIGNETLLDTFKEVKQSGFFIFIRTTTTPAQLIVDHVPVTLPRQSIIALTPLQYLQFQEGDDLLVYQFNREFYCIKHHDNEVGCAGLLFFGNQHIPLLTLDEKQLDSYTLIHRVFLEEFENNDAIQAEMLRILLARFIIKTTRLLKTKTSSVATTNTKQDMVRHYNVLVEEHFKKEHSVAFYAKKLFKSPKTLSNTFSKLNKSPLQIIHDRIILEAKRQLTYTSKTTKEIAYDIGFDDASHLSRLFKKQTGMSPTLFKNGSRTTQNLHL
ncbi:helix-turn-helix domain-containing protein [Cochleicola gelatinilyticus]|uniref:AraC family transcriptional regulator n=1 Tax=Cochleicola gelatinilyticus TaxID=1763537 RepID=A0A167J714_9FLAO|nr:helix-turn-helix domain-containing protein [Cochleicola gelatinilyticus]OAB80388.1 AraC family transcriptional regulator [Cochleicola gelatinilyticus]